MHDQDSGQGESGVPEEYYSKFMFNWREVNVVCQLKGIIPGGNFPSAMVQERGNGARQVKGIIPGGTFPSKVVQEERGKWCQHKSART
jgi:hypothetical protein